MRLIIIVIPLCFAAFLTVAGIPEDAESIKKEIFSFRHYTDTDCLLKNYAQEKGLSDNDLFDRLVFIAENCWDPDSDDYEKRRDAHIALQEIRVLPKSISVPYLEKQLYRRDAKWRQTAMYALGRFAESDECFYDITDKAAASGAISRDEVRCCLYGIIRHDVESPTKYKKEDYEGYFIPGGSPPHPTLIDLPANIRARMYRTLLLYLPGGDKSGFTVKGHDEELCKHMKDYARSRERLEQVALLAANTNASPALREKYAKELEKMKAIPEDELVCLLDLYPPTENELALQRKEAAATRPNVSVAEAVAEAPVVTANEQIESSSANRKFGLLVLTVIGGAVVCAIMLRRRRK